MVHVEADNFRFCLQAPCEKTDQAYVRTDSGPVADNPTGFGVIPVRPGDTVVWHYVDDDCDALAAPSYVACPGHEVQFESGQAASGTVGSMPARSGPQTLRWQVPADAAPGDILRYFCDQSDHWRLGVTGAFIVE